MNIDLYSDRAKQAVQSAQSLAMSRQHQQLAPEHLLKVLLEEKDGLARQQLCCSSGSSRRPMQASTGRIHSANSSPPPLIQHNRLASR